MWDRWYWWDYFDTQYWPVLPLTPEWVADLGDRTVANVYRNGVSVFGFIPSSVAISQALNESREHDMVVEGKPGEQVQYGDEIEVLIRGNVYGPYTVAAISRSVQEATVSTILTLAGPGDPLRSSATPDDDPFLASNNLVALLKIQSFVYGETGVNIPISFVNAEYVGMSAKFSVRSLNALDMLRDICGATGNSFRITDDGRVEIGKFGTDSGLIVNGNRAVVGTTVYTANVQNVDTNYAEMLSYLYVEGGSFLKRENPSDPNDKGQSVNLGLGSRYITKFTLEAPTGYTITEVQVAEKVHYKLTKIGATAKRGRRIQIAGITPLKENDLNSEKAAATSLAKMASLYLNAKSQPLVSLNVEIHDRVDIGLGDSVQVRHTPNGREIVNGTFYVKEWRLSSQDDAVTTTLSLSSVVVDPEELIKVTSATKEGRTGYKPDVPIGLEGVVLYVTVSASDSSCGAYPVGRSITVDYSTPGFQSVPHVTVECSPGVIGSVVSSTKNNCVICVQQAGAWSGSENVKVIATGTLNT